MTPPLPSLLAFDLDGTLVDSVADLAAAVTAFLTERGHAGVSAAQVRAMMGDGARELLERTLHLHGQTAEPVWLDEMAGRFLDMYDDWHHGETTLFPGTAETLAILRGRGYRMAVVTNKRVKPASRLLDRLGLAPLFDVVIGGDSTARPKPSPLPLEAAMAACDVTPAETVMVGDSINDIVMAHSVGATAVGCRYGYPRRPEDLDGADLLIDAMDTLPALLERRPC